MDDETVEAVKQEVAAAGLDLADVVKVDEAGEPIEYANAPGAPGPDDLDVEGGGVPDFDPLELIQHSNAQKVATLESMGVQLGFTVMSMRLEAALALLFPSEEAMRDLDLAFEQRLAPMLDQIGAQVKQQLLARDAAAGQQLLAAPGARR